jgi:hypothetical protein
MDDAATAAMNSRRDISISESALAEELSSAGKGAGLLPQRDRVLAPGERPAAN